MVNQLEKRFVPRRYNSPIHRAFVALIYPSIVALSSCGAAIRNDEAAPKDPSPECTIPWGTAERGLMSWGSGGNCLYGASVAPTVLDVWKWEGDAVEKREGIPIPDRACASTAWTTDDRYLAYAWGTDSRKAEFYLRNASTGKDVQHWPRESGWCEEISRPSLNGKYVAVFAFPDFSAPEHDFDAPDKLRVGRIGGETKEIQWVATQSETLHAGNVSRAIASDDGVLVAVAGWQYGAAVVNISERTVLWQRRPESDICKDIAISPDNKLIYTGGTDGCVYGMKVQDGEIVSRWWATPTGKSEYGFRISTISVSRDGHYVAAGTGPTGLVFLFSTKTGKLLRTLHHGGSTILITSFSPESTRLASVAAGKIKIWKLPEEAERPQADRPDADETTTVKEPVTQ